MNLEPVDINGLLRRYDLRPDKRLGQNFLVDPAALNQVVAAGQVSAQDTVLEIGPGLGSLTRLLSLQAHRVVAVELDSRLFPPLRDTLASYANVELVQGDILDLDLAQLMQGENSEQPDDYLVIANIPYYITSALIRRLLESDHPPRRLVLTIQREVAERICAHPGEMNLLALSVQVYGSPQVVASIPAGAFYPRPNVDSAVIRVERYPQPQIAAPLLGVFFQLAKAGFSQKRKTLRNSLAGGMRWKPAQAQARLSAAGIDPMRRAETLSLAEWIHLAETVAQDTEVR